jgi:hypothetical protein
MSQKIMDDRLTHGLLLTHTSIPSLTGAARLR